MASVFGSVDFLSARYSHIMSFNEICEEVKLFLNFGSNPESFVDSSSLSSILYYCGIRRNL